MTDRLADLGQQSAALLSERLVVCVYKDGWNVCVCVCLGGRLCSLGVGGLCCSFVAVEVNCMSECECVSPVKGQT